MPSSHYGRRMMVSKFYLKPFSSYWWKRLRHQRHNLKSKFSNFWPFISLFVFKCVGICPVRHQRKVHVEIIEQKPYRAFLGRHRWPKLSTSVTLVSLEVRRSSTTPKWSEASHYWGRIMVLKLYLKPFSRYKRLKTVKFVADDQILVFLVLFSRNNR